MDDQTDGQRDDGTATLELPGCQFTWTIGRMDRGTTGRQPWSFQGVDSHGRSDGWTEGQRDSNLGVSKVLIRMDDRTDGQRDNGTTTSELPGCRFAWTIGWMDRETTGRIQGKFHFIPTSFNSFIHPVIRSYVRPDLGEASVFLYYM